MNALIQWSGHPVVHQLGWTLLHFLWQGAVIAGVFAIVQLAQRKLTSNARYLTGCLALLLMLAAPLTTFFVLAPGPVNALIQPPRSTHTRDTPASPPAPPQSADIQREFHAPPAQPATPPTPNRSPNLTPSSVPSVPPWWIIGLRLAALCSLWLNILGLKSLHGSGRHFPLRRCRFQPQRRCV